MLRLDLGVAMGRIRFTTGVAAACVNWRGGAATATTESATPLLETAAAEGAGGGGEGEGEEAKWTVLVWLRLRWGVLVVVVVVVEVAVAVVDLVFLVLLRADLVVFFFVVVLTLKVIPDDAAALMARTRLRDEVARAREDAVGANKRLSTARFLIELTGLALTVAVAAELPVVEDDLFFSPFSLSWTTLFPLVNFAFCRLVAPC